jgi:large subunit ribosomal protein L15
MPLYRRLARRGFSNYPFKKEYFVVSLADLARKFEDGEEVTLETLRAKKLVKGKHTEVKILSNGEIDKKLTIKGLKVSGSAAEKITAAGGEVL